MRDDEMMRCRWAGWWFSGNGYPDWESLPRSGSERGSGGGSDPDGQSYVSRWKIGFLAVGC